MLFEVGKLYSRKDIWNILNVPIAQTKGNWFTGYTSYQNEHYVFVNIETQGRTGHEYNDHWIGEHLLYWRGKMGSTIHTPTIQKMISPDAVVHFFTREDNRNPLFRYEGLGRVNSVTDISPVQVTWSFE